MQDKMEIETPSMALRNKTTNLQDIEEIYSGLSQDELESLYYHGGCVEIDTKELQEIFETKYMQKIIYSDLLQGLNVTERKILLSHIIIDVNMKAQEMQISDTKYKYYDNSMKMNYERTTERYLAGILETIDVILLDNVAMPLLKKLAVYHGREEDVKSNNKVVEQLILQLITGISQNMYTTKLWRISYRKYEDENESFKLNEKYLRLEVFYKLTELTTQSGHFNNYPLLPKEQLEKHYVGEDKHSHMLKNGLQQNAKVIDLLNAVEKNIWATSKYIKLSTYSDYLRDELYEDGKLPHEIELEVSRRTQFLSTRLKLGKDELLYIPAKYDSRGRMYLSTYQLNPQGSKYEKQMLVPHQENFKDCKLTKDNVAVIHDNICIGIADALGYDKEQFHERVEIGKKHYLNEEENNIYADNYPILAHYREMLDGMRNGIYPATMIGLDATNQGLQLYSVLTGSKSVGKICNTASGDIRADAYQLLADELNKILITTFFDRDNCKKALMTTMYGKFDGMSEIALSVYGRYGEKESKNKLSKKLNKEYGELVDIFQEALKSIAPHAMELMLDILGTHEVLNNDEYTWTLPDGFKSRYRVRGDTKYSIFYVPKGKTNKYWIERTRFKVYTQNVLSRGLPANVIQSIDGYVMREMVRRMNGKFITSIHDAFYCHPEHMKLMKQNYKDILSEILQSNLIVDIMSQILGYNFEYNKMNTLTIQDIQESEFSLS